MIEVCVLRLFGVLTHCCWVLACEVHAIAECFWSLLDSCLDDLLRGVLARAGWRIIIATPAVGAFSKQVYCGDAQDMEILKGLCMSRNADAWVILKFSPNLEP